MVKISKEVGEDNCSLYSADSYIYPDSWSLYQPFYISTNDRKANLRTYLLIKC